MTPKDIFKIATFPVVMASLCCLAPVIVVLLGLGTVAFAASLTDILYGQYKWYFRLGGLILLVLAVIIYLWRGRGICTVDQVKKRRNEIINIVFISLGAGILGYIIFLYVIVEIIGLILGIWR